jgi:hypothetical protein
MENHPTIILGLMKTSSRINGGREERKRKTTRRVAKQMTQMIATMIPITEVRAARREKAEKDRKKA